MPRSASNKMLHKNLPPTQKNIRHQRERQIKDLERALRRKASLSKKVDSIPNNASHQNTSTPLYPYPLILLNQFIRYLPTQRSIPRRHWLYYIIMFMSNLPLTWARSTDYGQDGGVNTTVLHNTSILTNIPLSPETDQNFLIEQEGYPAEKLHHLPFLDTETIADIPTNPVKMLKIIANRLKQHPETSQESLAAWENLAPMLDIREASKKEIFPALLTRVANAYYKQKQYVKAFYYGSWTYLVYSRLDAPSSLEPPPILHEILEKTPLLQNREVAGQVLQALFHPACLFYLYLPLPGIDTSILMDLLSHYQQGNWENYFNKHNLPDEYSAIKASFLFFDKQQKGDLTNKESLRPIARNIINTSEKYQASKSLHAKSILQHLAMVELFFMKTFFDRRDIKDLNHNPATRLRTTQVVKDVLTPKLRQRMAKLDPINLKNITFEKQLINGFYPLTIKALEKDTAIFSCFLDPQNILLEQARILNAVSKGKNDRYTRKILCFISVTYYDLGLFISASGKNRTAVPELHLNLLAYAHIKAFNNSTDKNEQLENLNEAADCLKLFVKHLTQPKSLAHRHSIADQLNEKQKSGLYSAKLMLLWTQHKLAVLRGAKSDELRAHDLNFHRALIPCFTSEDKIMQNGSKDIVKMIKVIFENRFAKLETLKGSESQAAMENDCRIYKKNVALVDRKQSRAVLKYEDSAKDPVLFAGAHSTLGNHAIAENIITNHLRNYLTDNAYSPTSTGQLKHLTDCFNILTYVLFEQGKKNEALASYKSYRLHNALAKARTSPNEKTIWRKIYTFLITAILLLVVIQKIRKIRFNKNKKQNTAPVKTAKSGQHKQNKFNKKFVSSLKTLLTDVFGKKQSVAVDGNIVTVGLSWSREPDSDEVNLNGSTFHLLLSEKADLLTKTKKLLNNKLNAKTKVSLTVLQEDIKDLVYNASQECVADIKNKQLLAIKEEEEQKILAIKKKLQNKREDFTTLLKPIVKALCSEYASKQESSLACTIDKNGVINISADTSFWQLPGPLKTVLKTKISQGFSNKLQRKETCLLCIDISNDDATTIDAYIKKLKQHQVPTSASGSSSNSASIAPPPRSPSVTGQNSVASKTSQISSTSHPIQKRSRGKKKAPRNEEEQNKHSQYEPSQVDYSDKTPGLEVAIEHAKADARKKAGLSIGYPRPTNMTLNAINKAPTSMPKYKHVRQGNKLNTTKQARVEQLVEILKQLQTIYNGALKPRYGYFPHKYLLIQILRIFQTIAPKKVHQQFRNINDLTNTMVHDVIAMTDKALCKYIEHDFLDDNKKGSIAHKIHETFNMNAYTSSSNNRFMSWENNKKMVEVDNKRYNRSSSFIPAKPVATILKNIWSDLTNEKEVTDLLFGNEVKMFIIVLFEEVKKHNGISFKLEDWNLLELTRGNLAHDNDNEIKAKNLNEIVEASNLVFTINMLKNYGDEIQQLIHDLSGATSYKNQKSSNSNLFKPDNQNESNRSINKHPDRREAPGPSSG
jgi:hypothetical protein